MCPLYLESNHINFIETTINSKNLHVPKSITFRTQSVFRENAIQGSVKFDKYKNVKYYMCIYTYIPMMQHHAEIVTTSKIQNIVCFMTYVKFR